MRFNDKLLNLTKPPLFPREERRPGGQPKEERRPAGRRPKSLTIRDRLEARRTPDEELRTQSWEGSREGVRLLIRVTDNRRSVAEDIVNPTEDREVQIVIIRKRQIEIVLRVDYRT